MKVAFQGSRVTSDGGLLLVRELDEHLGMTQLIAQHLTDPRGTNTRLPLADLLRQSVYSRLAGYEDVNDAERLSQDPTFRLIGSEKTWLSCGSTTSGEQCIKEGKQATHWTRRSCRRFRANEVRLQLSVLAYDLGNLWRRLVKTGGRLVKHARYYWLLLAEGHLTR
ncbi:MAG: transposase, partial [Acidobacteria bacterium]|nr:transposase [Acidobacteriota bacterium]